MIVRPDLSPDIRNTLNKVMYTHYTKWAFYETVRFKTFHYYKCKHIPTEELHMYSLLGLQNGIEKYDGVHSFTNWIHYHIKRRLYEGMTQLQPITMVSAKKRMIRKTSPQEKNPKTQFAGHDDEWIFDKNVKNDESDSTDVMKTGIWAKIDTMPASKRKIFQYKYDYDFTMLRSNKEIAELMACSEENIRQTLHKVKKELVNKPKNK
jgi:RNA polymerase sigma factor (sigma-70 family)